MIHREQKRGGWKILLAVIVLALLSCGVLIALDVRKVSAEKKFERKFAKEKTMSTVSPSLPTRRDPDNN